MTTAILEDKQKKIFTGIICFLLSFPIMFYKWHVVSLYYHTFIAKTFSLPSLSFWLIGALCYSISLIKGQAARDNTQPVSDLTAIALFHVIFAHIGYLIFKGLI